ncbi:MAG: acylneuraminate cytidylyltransferase [Bdellovibrionales bacterium]|nr:acylneuraminate cytidylyltransferase [Bdellovibrionales bacterium]
MKSIVVAALLALSFTTGFTCSKNTPAENATPAAQEQMAAPAAPAEGQAAPAEGAAPAAEAPAATPAAETK